MKLKIGFVFLFLFIFSVVLVSADYDIPSKYQKSEFNSSKWIQSYHNLTIDNFNELICLDTTFINDYENMSDYYYYDKFPANNYITVHNDTYFTSYHNDFDDLNYLRYNYTLTPNNEWDIFFKFKYNSSVSSSYTHIMMFGSEENGFRDCLENSTNHVSIRLRRHETLNQANIFILGEVDDVWWFDSSLNEINFNVFYYAHYFKIGSNVTLNVYSDKAFTNRKIHLSYNGLNAGISYDYFYSISTQYPLAGGKDLDVDIINFINNETLNKEIYFNNGSLYTKNLLENTTEKSVMIGFNSTAYIDTITSLYASDDNATWKLLLQNDGLGSLSQYHEILYNYSSLYVRLNLTTINPLFTPFVDDLFYFHTYECAVSDETKPYVFITLFTIIGMILGYAIDRT